MRSASRQNVDLLISSMRKLRLVFEIILGLTIVVAMTGCHRSATSADDNTPDNSTYRPQATPATQFERDLKYVRDAHFAHVWLFSRKDGKELTKDDSEVLRTNAPRVVDWVVTDQSRKVLADSNFDLDPPQMLALQKRFKIEDYTGK
jgi:hypothetical protein